MNNLFKYFVCLVLCLMEIEREGAQLLNYFRLYCILFITEVLFTLIFEFLCIFTIYISYICLYCRVYKQNHIYVHTRMLIYIYIYIYIYRHESNTFINFGELDRLIHDIFIKLKTKQS